MVKPVFDIASDDIAADQWMHCRLMLLLNASYLQYAILQDKNLLVWKHYQFASADEQEGYSATQEIFNQDSALTQAVKDQVIVYDCPESCLIPETLQSQEVNRPLFDLAHGTGVKGLVITEKVTACPLYNVFRLPAELDRISRAKFPSASFQHHASLWLASFKKQPDRDDQLSLIFHAKEIHVSLVKQHQLLLVQSFAYHHPADVLYDLLNICRLSGLDPRTFPVYVSGLIEFNSFMYHELVKYFGNVEADSVSEKFLISKNFRSVPEHFFTPLLKMSRCV